MLEDAHYCLASLCALEDALGTLLGVDGPGFSAAKDALDSVIRYIETMADNAREAKVVKETGTQHGGAANSADVAGGFHAGDIRSRTEALAQLRAVADFFRRTEPHSPVAYLADKAATWGAAFA